MTYKEIVDRIEAAVNDHGMLADFGYGQLSDIKVLDDDGDGANYPYAFLTPAGVTRQNQATTYGFSLIMMEMALTPRDILKVQSDCIQYLNDVIAVLRFDSSFSGDLLLNNSIQVFRERFQDEVAGATATFQIQVPDPINLCDAPIAEWSNNDPVSYTNRVVDTYEVLSIRPNPCQNGNLNTNQWKYTFDIRYTALKDLSSWEWPYISIWTTDGNTGEKTVKARVPLDITAVGVSLIQSVEFEIDCPMSDSEADTLNWGFGDWRDEAVITDAIEFDGSVRAQYKYIPTP